VIVATVFENSTASAQEVEILFHTLEQFGGELARARRVACAVGEVDPFFAEVLGDLGVQLLVGEGDPAGDAELDILRTVAAVDDDCDVLLALRSDVAFAGDVSGWLDADALGARVAADGSIELHVLAIPAARAAQLAARARELVPELRAWNQAGPIEQAALAMAATQLELPVHALPPEVAFPINGDKASIQAAYDVAPLLVVHDHVLQPTGEIVPCGLPVPDTIIERINAELRPADAPAPAVAEVATAGGEHPYFPTRNASVLAVEAQYRAHVGQLREHARYLAYEAFTRQHGALVESTFRADGEQVVVHQLERDITYPTPLPLIKYSHISFGYEQWLEHKYSLPGYVTVEPGDVVIDCGAFVGGFSLAAARVASTVHLFEPEPANVACIERNFAGADNVVVNQMGLFTTTGTEWLNVSESGVEHSMLQPDDGDAVDRISIEVTRLDDYCERRALAGIDFLKVEAEGVELEVLQGLGDVRPAKVAVDVSPERDGTSPAEQITALLAGWGYDTRQRANVLFARYAGGGAGN
jgi:FkbM family methyltransferase